MNNIGDTTPNMYDDTSVRIEEFPTMSVISVEDLDDDQVVGENNVDEPIPDNDSVIWDDEERPDDPDEGIYDDEELSVFEDDESEEDDEYDDTGMDEDFFEDLNEDNEDGDI